MIVVPRFFSWFFGRPTAWLGLIQPRAISDQQARHRPSRVRQPLFHTATQVLQPDTRPKFEGWCINCGETFTRRAASMAEFFDELMDARCSEAYINQWPPGHHLTKIVELASGLTVLPFVSGLCRCGSKNGDHTPGCDWKGKATQRCYAPVTARGLSHSHGDLPESCRVLFLGEVCPNVGNHWRNA